MTQSVVERVARAMDEALESAIDEVGRDRVFARARAHGYSPGSGAIEKWMWWQIVRDLRENVGPPPQRLDVELLGFKLF